MYRQFEEVMRRREEEGRGGTFGVGLGGEGGNDGRFEGALGEEAVPDNDASDMDIIDASDVLMW